MRLRINPLADFFRPAEVSIRRRRAWLAGALLVFSLLSCRALSPQPTPTLKTDTAGLPDRFILPELQDLALPSATPLPPSPTPRPSATPLPTATPEAIPAAGDRSAFTAALDELLTQAGWWVARSGDLLVATRAENGLTWVMRVEPVSSDLNRVALEVPLRLGAGQTLASLAAALPELRIQTDSAQYGQVILREYYYFGSALPARAFSAWLSYLESQLIQAVQEKWVAPPPA